MKKISPSIVMVEDITSSQPRTTFLENDLKKAAELILELEGTINPPVLKKNGMDSYSVISGDFEYYAAVKAEEIDPMKAEMINAYVVESKEEVLLYKKQIELFRQRKNASSGFLDQKEITERKEHENTTELLDAIQFLTKQINNIQAQQNKHSLEVNKKFNSLQETIAKIQPDKLKKPKEVIKGDFLTDFNDKKKTIEFTKKLENIGVKGKPAKSLIKARGKIILKSLADITDIGGVGPQTEKTIRKNWY